MFISRRNQSPDALRYLRNGTSRCRPVGGSFSTGSASQDAVVGSVPLGINSVSASGDGGPEA
jgi:hypothetical protein